MSDDYLNAYHQRLTGNGSTGGTGRGARLVPFGRLDELSNSNQDNIRKWGEDQFALAVGASNAYL